MSIKPVSMKPVPLKSSISRRTFPWTAPTWPDSVEQPLVKKSLGVDYQTDWARRYGARLARVMMTEAVTRPLAHLLAAPTIDGLDRLEQLDEPLIFAANHASHIDTPLLLSVLPDRWRHRTVVAGAADYFFDRRWKAAFFALTINAIPVERQRVNRRSAAVVESLLNDGWSLLIYPEGGRTPDGWGQTHTRGAAWLALRSNRAIVPVYVEGTRRVLPRHGSRVHLAKTRVTFGAPIRPAAKMDAWELSAQVEAALSMLADEQQTDWWSARRRAAAGTTPPLTGPTAGAWRRGWALDKRPQPGDGTGRSWPRL